MLVDLPANWRESVVDENQKAYADMLRDLHFERDKIVYPIRLAQGVYLDHLNFDHEIEHLTWDLDNNRNHDYANSVLRLWTHELHESHGEWDLIEPEIIPVAWESYGVCDHWSQILVKFSQLQTSVIPYLVRVSLLRKEDQDPQGGWCWHKWGPYIGAFQEQARNHEYLYDTPDVEEVFVYEVHEMRYPW